VAAIRQLAERLRYLDVDRVGIVGHSSGGYNAVLAMLAFPDFYKVGVSSAPGIDYTEVVRQVTERWQGPPDENRANYEAVTLANTAGRLKGKLLLAFADLDENAPAGPIIHFIDALTTANKSYDLILMPNRRHGFSFDPYFRRRAADYFVEHLMGSEPPLG
jgi:dipeptidyl aminopeptidase/acylaminoacyl peptidase